MQRQDNKNGEVSRDRTSNAKDKLESLASRIASSASGLAKDIARSSSHVDAAGTLISSTSTSQKAAYGSSSAQSSRWTESLPARTKGPTLGPSNRFDGDLNNTSFRNSQQPDSASVEFNDFTQGYGQSSGSEKRRYVEPSSWAVDFTRPQNTSLKAEMKPYFPINDYGSLTDYDDGAEVRELLSRPGGLGEMDDTGCFLDDSTAETVSDLFGEQYSETEEMIAHHLKSSLPQPPVHGSIPAEHPLNLRPELLSLGGNDPTLLQEVQDLTESLEYVSENTNTYLSDAQQRHLLSEWNDVLNSYTDEVWGSMLPAVQEARSQIQELQTSKESLDVKAVTRLKMILGHVVQNGDFILGHMRNQHSATRDTLHSRPTTVHRPEQVDSILQKDKLKAPLFSNCVHEIYSQYANRQATQSSKSLQQNADLNHLATHSSHNEPQDKPEPPPVPTFHCPWVSCHERFINATELHMHTKSHTMLACPHTDCDASFSEPDDWIEHWQEAHHGLLDTRMDKP